MKLNQVEALAEQIASADAVVIGAGAGLSSSAGFEYDGKRFERYFSDFAKAYGFRDMYSGGFYPYDTLEEHWAYWSRYILINRYQNPPKPVYETLLQLIGGKDYFVLTTNVDHCFQKAGFEKQRLFYTQGDYGLWQCSEPCHQTTYDNEKLVRQMAERQKDMRVPGALAPHCPVCGKPMIMNLRADHRFVEDAGWHQAAGRYKDFLRSHEGARTLYLELGVGMNTPGIIKYQFWNMTYQNPNAIYAIVNAANSQMCGCFQPLHACIDNMIHTKAGIALRLKCNEIMQKQGHEEPVGQAKITPAYNLPSQYVIHTVGPIIQTGYPSEAQKEQLASCYRSCLKLAAESGCKSISFCCISTGVFMFPNREAAEIAVRTVKEFLTEDREMERVIFNVFKDADREIYEELLGMACGETGAAYIPK